MKKVIRNYKLYFLILQIVNFISLLFPPVQIQNGAEMNVSMSGQYTEHFRSNIAYIKNKVHIFPCFHSHFNIDLGHSIADNKHPLWIRSDLSWIIYQLSMLTSLPKYVIYVNPRARRNGLLCLLKVIFYINCDTHSYNLCYKFLKLWYKFYILYIDSPRLITLSGDSYPSCSHITEFETQPLWQQMHLIRQWNHALICNFQSFDLHYSFKNSCLQLSTFSVIEE